MNDQDYMYIAIEEAKSAKHAGEVPIGAIVVFQPINKETRKPLAQPRIVAKMHNCREFHDDPCGHAELKALQEAARVLGTWRLSDCTVYVTLEPCVMCAGAMHQARIARCVWGAPNPKAGALGSLYAVHADTRLNHTFAVEGGVLEHECADVLREFFADKRGHKHAGKERG